MARIRAGSACGLPIGVQAGPPLGTEDEVAGGELLFALHGSEHGTAAEDEEHLFGAVVHVQPHPFAPGLSSQSVAPIRALSGRQKVRCGKSGVGPAFLRVPGLVGEQVLALHR